MPEQHTIKVDVLATNLIEIVKANISDMSPDVTLYKLFVKEIVSSLFAGTDYKLKLMDDLVECPRCEGQGKIMISYDLGERSLPCDKCDSSGKVVR